MIVNDVRSIVVKIKFEWEKHDLNALELPSERILARYGKWVKKILIWIVES